jgi:2,3-bisphosphoglycerate-dependent phosphoglycerate mutase
MRFYFIRHGQSTNNALYESAGSDRGRNYDPELTSVGHRQAELLGEYIRQRNDSQAFREGRRLEPEFTFTHLYTSLMIRSVATASILAEKLGIPLHGWEIIHENGGLYQGDETSDLKTGQAGPGRHFFEANYPHLILLDSLGEEGWWNRPYEPDEERPLRARRFLDELLARHGGNETHVAVVSHGGFYNEMMNLLIGMKTGLGYWFMLNNTGISRIDFSGVEIRLIYLNRLDFLPIDLVT